jgi:hypothetical protein
MLLVEPWRCISRDEELRSVSIRSSVRHADRIWTILYQVSKCTTNKKVAKPTDHASLHL